MDTIKSDSVIDLADFVDGWLPDAAEPGAVVYWQNKDKGLVDFVTRHTTSEPLIAGDAKTHFFIETKDGYRVSSNGRVTKL